MDRMSIGDFARATGLTTKALRLYDEMGLVRPAEVDEYSGYRYYRDDQLDRARLVARLRLIGMPLDRIRVIADLASRTGIGSRDHQLDALLAGDRVYAVADGFGSDPATAARALCEVAALDGVTGVVDPVRLLDEAVGAAASAVAELPRGGPGDDGPGCTLTALLLGGPEVAIAHVGDSRAYLLRDGRLARLTRDHTVVQSLVDEGRLSEEEARSDGRRDELNRALLAGASAKPDISLHATRPGDRFVLTTDGVHAVLPPGELCALLMDGATPEDVVTLVEAAVLAAGAPDNYAVVAVDLPVSGG